MKLISYADGFGRIEEDQVVPMGPSILEYLRSGTFEDSDPIAADSVTYLAPVPDPGKIICIGLNYRDHAEEAGLEVPLEPILFPKFANSVVGNEEAIVIPEVAGGIDYEAELGVVIGRKASRVSSETALEYVAGYTCLNDVSSRDLQFGNGGQWTLGKAIDTFLPSGPWIITADEILDPQCLPIKCTLNGKLVQDSNTSEMIFGVAELISFISQTMTLEPGDIVASGTPAGVGFVRTPRLELSAGDEVVVEIVGVGRIVNPVTDPDPVDSSV